jgi:hypothetical protein
MKTKARVKEKSGKRWRQGIGKARSGFLSQPVCLHRRGGSEFSCGIVYQGAFLVEESLAEREGGG